MKRKCHCGGTIRKLSSFKPGRIQIGPRLSTPVVLSHQCDKCNTFYGSESAVLKEIKPNANQ